MIKRLKIEGFRGFRHLSVNEFAQANLIVGKNNCGKTSLLEALRFLVSTDYMATLSNILIERNDSGGRNESRSESFGFAKPVERLFFGCPEIDVTPVEAVVTDCHELEVVMSASLRPFEARMTPGQAVLPFPDYAQDSVLTSSDLVPVLNVTRNSVKIFEISLHSHPRVIRTFDEQLRPIGLGSQVFVPPEGTRANELPFLWDQVALTDAEADVIECLRLFDPRIQRIAFLQGDASSRARKPMAKIDGFPRPIPLKIMGDGMNRALGIIMAMLNCKDGYVFIDEIENGIHYSVKVDVWKLLLESSQKWNIQIFATTHSWDSIEAFHAAMADLGTSDGRLIRLDLVDGEHRAVVLDPHDLEIAAKRRIEVR
jgi:hypothetical protein